MALSAGRIVFLQRQGALGAVLADGGRGWLLCPLRRVRGLQAALLQRPQGLPVLVSRASRVSTRPPRCWRVVDGLCCGSGSSREGPEASGGGSVWALGQTREGEAKLWGVKLVQTI